jgi:hypothetical protein
MRVIFLKSSSKLLYKGIPLGIPYLPIFVVKLIGAVSTAPLEVALFEDIGYEPEQRFSRILPIPSLFQSDFRSLSEICGA